MTDQGRTTSRSFTSCGLYSAPQPVEPGGRNVQRNVHKTATFTLGENGLEVNSKPVHIRPEADIHVGRECVGNPDRLSDKDNFHKVSEKGPSSENARTAQAEYPSWICPDCGLTYGNHRVGNAATSAG